MRLTDVDEVFPVRCKMRILNVVQSVNPLYGGTVETVRRMSEAIQRAGHVVEVVTVDDQSVEYVANFPVFVHGLGPSWGGSYGFSKHLVPWLKKNASKFDGIIVHGIWDYVGLATWKAVKSSGVPYAVFPHGMLDPWFQRTYPLKHLKKQIYWKLYGGAVLRDAFSVIFTNEEERRLAMEGGFGQNYRALVVAFGTEGPPVSECELEQRRAFRDQLPELTDRKFILFMARIHEKKGCDLLVRAFAKIASRVPEMDLVIAGPDQTGLREKLDEMAEALEIRPRVIFPGMLQGAAKWGAYREADVFILPSHQENFGFVLPEAMACGCAVLTTNKVNIWREIDGYGAGFIDEDTDDGVLRLLARWVDLPVEDKAQIRRAALDTFEKRFHVDALAFDIVEVVKRMVVGARRHRN